MEVQGAYRPWYSTFGFCYPDVFDNKINLDLNAFYIDTEEKNSV